MTIKIDIIELNNTESEVLANLAGLGYPQKLKDRATNLARRAFRLWRAMMFVEEIIERRKQQNHG